jgi:hypothetical protein
VTVTDLLAHVDDSMYGAISELRVYLSSPRRRAALVDQARLRLLTAVEAFAGASEVGGVWGRRNGTGVLRG